MAGTDLPVTVRVMNLCNELKIHHRLGGPEAAERTARARSGTAFDPDLVGLFCRDRDTVLAVIERPALWADVLAAEPSPHRHLTPAELVDAAHVMGDFADLKSRYLAGH